MNDEEIIEKMYKRTIELEREYLQQQIISFNQKTNRSDVVNTLLNDLDEVIANEDTED